MNDWSRGHLKAAVGWVDIDNPILQRYPPPFIVFKGSKDFSLTDQEIKSLRSYLHLNGKIWGDNAKGGLGSSFDFAFRREMKRVISDPDKKFAPIGPGDRIFTHSWFDLTKAPAGTYTVEHLDRDRTLDGLNAIIYTPNHVLDQSVPEEQLGMNIICNALIRY